MRDNGSEAGKDGVNELLGKRGGRSGNECGRVTADCRTVCVMRMAPWCSRCRWPYTLATALRCPLDHMYLCRAPAAWVCCACVSPRPWAPPKLWLWVSLPCLASLCSLVTLKHSLEYSYNSHIAAITITSHEVAGKKGGSVLRHILSQIMYICYGHKLRSRLA